MQLLYVAFLLKLSTSASVDKDLLELQKEKSVIIDKLDRAIQKEMDAMPNIQNEENLNKHEKKLLDLRSHINEMRNDDALEQAEDKVNSSGILSRVLRRQMNAALPTGVSIPVGVSDPLVVDVVEGHREVIKFNGKIKDVYIQKDDFDRPADNALNKHRWFFSDLSDESVSDTNRTIIYNWEQCPRWGKKGNNNVYPCCRKCCKESMLGCLRRKR